MFRHSETSPPGESVSAPLNTSTRDGVESGVFQARLTARRVTVESVSAWMPAIFGSGWSETTRILRVYRKGAS